MSTSIPDKLRRILLPSLKPCANFDGACRNSCQWHPLSGHIPRGYCGAYGEIEQVRLIVVTAEPGDPANDEKYTGSPETMLDASVEFAKCYLENDSLRRGNRAAAFHRNLQKILSLCWPDKSLREQLEYTWLTNSVHCSAEESGGSIPADVASVCIDTYLKKEISALPNAYILALGGKAVRRLKRYGVRVDGTAQHPSARPASKPEVTWERAGKKFRDWLEVQAR